MDTQARELEGWADPRDLFLAEEARAETAFWLDAGPAADAGWSFLGTGERGGAGDVAGVRLDSPAADASGGGTSPVAPRDRPACPVADDDAVPSAGRERSVRLTSGKGAPSSAMSGPVPPASGSLPLLPEAPPFLGGWVGWLEYEGGMSWLRARRLLAFDHARRRVWVVAPPTDLDEWSRSAQERVRRAGDAASGAPVDGAARRPRNEPVPAEAPITAGGALPAGGTTSTGAPVPAAAPPVVAAARNSPAEYAALIERCRESIRAGDAYQLCLTTRFSVPGAVDPVAAYLRLREATPSPRGSFIRIGERILLSASPEQFLEVRDGIVRTRPIKGTRPRDADPAADSALAEELRAHPKERAENVMIVDLMRNDLSRVCDPGSIRVDALFSVESYAAVHQLVSAVRGRIATGTTAGDLWAAAFPAGSMTGAPKESAMGLLRGLEGAPRGLYSGCAGYLGTDGRMDLAMVIRSVVIEPGGVSVGAGGGITWGSEAAAEVAEVATKARAPLAAAGAVLPPEWESARRRTSETAARPGAGDAAGRRVG